MLTCLPDYLCACPHVRMSVCLHFFMSVCLHFACLSLHPHACISWCVHVCVSAWLHVCISWCVLVCVSAWLHTCTCLCTCVCMHDRVCMSACLCDCLPGKHNPPWDGANNGGLTCCTTLLADLWSCCPHIKVLLFLITIWLKLDMNLNQKMENYHLQEKLK